jgi:hypothetical protein
MGVGQDGEGLDEAEERLGLGRLSFGFGFEWSKACAGVDGPWAVIFVLVGGFTIKMGYPVLLVSDTGLAKTCMYQHKTQVQLNRLDQN